MLALLALVAARPPADLPLDAVPDRPRPPARDRAGADRRGGGERRPLGRARARRSASGASRSARSLMDVGRAALRRARSCAALVRRRRSPVACSALAHARRLAARVCRAGRSRRSAGSRVRSGRAASGDRARWHAARGHAASTLLAARNSPPGRLRVVRAGRSGGSASTRGRSGQGLWAASCGRPSARTSGQSRPSALPAAGGSGRGSPPRTAARGRPSRAPRPRAARRPRARARAASSSRQPDDRVDELARRRHEHARAGLAEVRRHLVVVRDRRHAEPDELADLGRLDALSFVRG